LRADENPDCRLENDVNDIESKDGGDKCEAEKETLNVSVTNAKTIQDIVMRTWSQSVPPVSFVASKFSRYCGSSNERR
jgi:hypothetical protein